MSFEQYSHEEQVRIRDATKISLLIMEDSVQNLIDEIDRDDEYATELILGAAKYAKDPTLQDDANEANVLAGVMVNYLRACRLLNEVEALINNPNRN